MEKILNQELIQIDYLRLILGVVILISEILVIKFLYEKFSHSYNNKMKFSKNFIPFGISILIIVSVIKSSLALSLGLIGALSIIRFRTAIKEPEEIIILLLIMGGAVSIAAEKEILSLILISIYCLSYFLINKAERTNEKSHLTVFRIEEASLKNDNLLTNKYSNFIDQFSFKNDGLIIVYYSISDINLLNEILETYKEKNYKFSVESIVNNES